MAQRGPQRMVAEELRAVAIAHLQRFPTSAVGLRRVLRRKIRRSVQHHGDEPGPLLAAAEAVIEALQGGAWLDDTRFAAAVARTLHRRGKSQRGVAQALRQKGLNAEDIEAALAGLGDNPAEVEWAAALRYAQRRRLGPFRRDPSTRADNTRRDMAAMARQGFSYGLVRRILDAEDEDALALPE
jgi:regulatory protein